MVFILPLPVISLYLSFSYYYQSLELCSARLGRVKKGESHVMTKKFFLRQYGKADNVFKRITLEISASFIGQIDMEFAC